MTEQHSNEILVDLIQNTQDKADLGRYLAELYQQNYLFIVKVCKRYTGYAELEDLLQESFFGLRIAADRYDPEQGVPFMNYAVVWIAQTIIRYLENTGNAVRIPSYLFQNIIKYRRIERTFLQEHGRKPTDEELVELMGLRNHAQLKRIKDRAEILNLLSIDREVSSEDGSERFVDIIPDPVDHYEEIQDQIDDEIRQRDIWEEVEKLDERKAEIIKKRFKDNMSLKDIGKEFGVSNEAIRQSQDKALKRLSKSKKLRRYAADYLSAYSGTGISSYRKTGTSATERTAINIYEQTVRNYTRKNEASITRIKKSIIRDLMKESI